MKELKKLALILRALGITAKVVSEEITYNGAFLIYTNGHGTIEVALSWEYDRSINKRKSITRYHTDMPLKINWNYSMCGGDKSELSLEDFVKELVRRGIIKVEG